MKQNHLIIFLTFVTKMIAYYMLQETNPEGLLLSSSSKLSTHAHERSKRADSVDSQHMCMALYEMPAPLFLLMTNSEVMEI